LAQTDVLPQRTNTSGIERIVLQNSVFANEQNFQKALVRSSEIYVGGHIVKPFSNR
jgi:hypothetical protein